MVITKEKAECVPLDPTKPLPKYGHLSALDPDFAKLKPATDAMIEQVSLSLSLEKFRKMWQNESAPPEGCPKKGVDVVTGTRKIPMRDGDEVEIKIYRAKEKKPGLALTMRFHGGGLVAWGALYGAFGGSAYCWQGELGGCGCGLQNAPEFRFPYSVNDSFDALKGSKSNASSLLLAPSLKDLTPTLVMIAE